MEDGIDVGAVVEETGTQEGTITESQSEVITSGDQSGPDLQDRMEAAEDYWYSDGIDGYYGPNGEPVLDKNGEYVRTKEQLDNVLGKQEPQTPQAKIIEPKQESKTGGQSIFETDGQFDPVKGSQLMKEFDTPYVSAFERNIQQATDPQGTQQQESEQKQTLSQKVLEYDNTLKTNLLNPFIEIKNAMMEAGTWNSENPAAVRLDQQIREKTQVIDDLVREKQMKLWEETFTSKEQEKTQSEQMKALQEQVEKSVFEVSKKYNGRESFESLMLGRLDQDNKFIPGEGHDLVLALADLLNDGQNVKDISEATKNAWNKMAKNPQILATISKYVAGYHLAKNISKNNALVRKETLADERGKRKLVGTPAQAITPSGQQSQGGMPQEIADYFGYSTI